MAYYLIDYENTKKLNGCNNLSEMDTIVFFYSQNANSLTFDLHIELGQIVAKKEYFLVNCGGKNALDFQMSSYVGFLLATYPNEKIFIISKDKGYLYLLSFWNERGFNQIELKENIFGEIIDDDEINTFEENEISNDAEAPKPKSQNQLSVLLKNNASKLGLTKEHQSEIERIIKNYKTKQAINNNLMKLFRDSDKVGRITKIIKPFLKGKK
jgi:hypothetical protein